MVGALVHYTKLLTAKDFLFFCDLYLKFIPPINLWNICINLRLFLKYKKGPFLRPLRSKDDWCWVLRLRPWNFVIISESLAANLEKARQTSVWQTVPKFWFIWLWHLSFCITYKSKSLRNNKKDKQIRILAHIFRFLWFMPSLGVCSLWSVIATIRHSPASHLCPTFNFISILTLKCFILMMFCLSWDHHC